MTRCLQRDVMSVLMSNSDVERDDLEQLVDKIATLFNHTTHQRQATLLNHTPRALTSSTTTLPDHFIPRDCHDVYASSSHVSAVYEIHPESARHTLGVYCEMINGSGWTVIQRRVDGTVSFQRNWDDYKYGFGGPYGEFWIGLDTIHLLTAQRDYRLRVDLWDWEGDRGFAEYDTFRVDSELNKYRLRVLGYHGNAGDSLSYHDDMAFSTHDADNDLTMRNCAEDNQSGWWFNTSANRIVVCRLRY